MQGTFNGKRHMINVLSSNGNNNMRICPQPVRKRQESLIYIIRCNRFIQAIISKGTLQLFKEKEMLPIRRIRRGRGGRIRITLCM